MADPLSIAASVVQFLDISVRLCLKLNHFCAEMRDVPHKLHSLEADLRQQNSVAQGIQELINKSPAAINVSSLSVLAGILGDYSKTMKRLLLVLGSVTSNNDAGLLKRGWNAIRAIEKKAEILCCCDTMAKQRSVLSLWLSHLNINLSCDIIHINERSLSETLRLSSRLDEESSKMDIAVQQVPKLVRLVEEASAGADIAAAHVDNTQKEILTAVYQTRSDICGLAQEWAHLKSTMNDFHHLLQSNAQISETVDRTIASSKPDVNESQTDRIEDILQTIGNIHINDEQRENQASSNPISRGSLCNCRAFSQATGLEPLSMLHFRRIFRKQHFADCPKAKTSEQSLEFTMRIIPPKWLLCHTLHLSLVIRNWCTNAGFSISPMVLGTRRIIDSEVSPAFQAVRRYYATVRTAVFEGQTQLPVSANSLHTTLCHMLDNNQCSVFDEDDQGTTLLYQVLDLQVRLGGSQWFWDDFSHLIEFLLDRGSNPNVTCTRLPITGGLGNKEGTALDIFGAALLRDEVEAGSVSKNSLLCSKLIKEGGEFSRALFSVEDFHASYQPASFEEELALLQRFPEQIELCQYNGLIAAIRQRSKPRFQRCLVRSDINYQSPVNGLSPVHFAITWPYALRILVESGVNIDSKDNYCRRPIHLAVALGQMESVRILLQADCAISCHDRGFECLLQTAPSLNCMQSREDIGSAIAEALIDRHIRLLNLAILVLPVSCSECRVDTQTDVTEIRLDERLAPDIIQHLEHHGCIIPPALDLDNKSLYQSTNTYRSGQFHLKLAEKFWNAGFRDLETHYSDGFTPLLHSWLVMDFEMISWLLEKGVSPYSRHKEMGSSGLHLLAVSLHQMGPYLSSSWFDMSTESIELTLIAQLNMKDSAQTDSCSCLCCPDGCTPFVTFLGKGSYYGVVGEREEMPYSAKVERLRVWERLGLAAGRMSSQLNEHLRLIAFERLRLRHTCCVMGKIRRNNSWDMYYSKYSRVFTPQDLPKAQQEVLLNKELETYINRTRDCHCPTLEKPLCIAFHQSCPTRLTVNEEA